MKRVTITIPDKLYEKIEEYKDENGYASVSELVRDAIKKFLREGA